MTNRRKILKELEEELNLEDLGGNRYKDRNTEKLYYLTSKGFVPIDPNEDLNIVDYLVIVVFMLILASIGFFIGLYIC